MNHRHWNELLVMDVIAGLSGFSELLDWII